VERNNGLAEKGVPTRNALYNTVQEGCCHVAKRVNHNEDQKRVQSGDMDSVWRDGF